MSVICNYNVGYVLKNYKIYFFTRLLRQREESCQEKLDSPAEYCILGFGQPPKKIYFDKEKKTKNKLTS